MRCSGPIKLEESSQVKDDNGLRASDGTVKAIEVSQKIFLDPVGVIIGNEEHEENDILLPENTNYPSYAQSVPAGRKTSSGRASNTIIVDTFG